MTKEVTKLAKEENIKTETIYKILNNRDIKKQNKFCNYGASLIQLNNELPPLSRFAEGKERTNRSNRIMDKIEKIFNKAN